MDDLQMKIDGVFYFFLIAHLVQVAVMLTLFVSLVYDLEDRFAKKDPDDDT